MKLTSRAVAVATALLGSASAGVLDGPCNITADMSTLTGTYPDGVEICLDFVQLQPSKIDPAEMIVAHGCLKTSPPSALLHQPLAQRSHLIQVPTQVCFVGFCVQVVSAIPANL